MNESTKELIAIRASFAVNCQPCIAFHVNKVRDLGMSDDETNEAITIGRMIRKGAMSAMDKFTESMLGSSENKSSTCCDNNAGNCCR